jgi:hypothetical protein
MKSHSLLLIFVLSALSFVGVGCNQDPTASNLTSDSTGDGEEDAADADNQCTSPETNVIWKGERSIATTAASRGAWSDIELNPDTGYLGTAYIDAGCACIRFTYWDGNNFVDEVIAAGSTTSFTHIRLAYLGDGTPIVVWSNSLTRLQMAIRDSEDMSVSSTWTMKDLDTSGTIMRAIQIKVNPDDEVAIVYGRNTAGSVHIIVCDDDCDSVANYSAASTTLGTSGTTPHIFGLGWCKDGTDYYPVVAFPGAAQVHYAVCRLADINGCLAGIAAWQGGAVQTFTGSGANRASVALAMDDTTDDAPIRAVLNNGAGIAYYQSAFAGGGCADGTVGAIAAGGNITGTAATSGATYMDIERDSGNDYHLVGNLTTTVVHYFNTTTGSFTAWNAAGAVATATLGAAGATRGGIAVDEALGQVYTSFSRTSAAGAFNGNLTLGWVEDMTVASNGAAAEYYITPMTTDGQLQMTASQVPNVSVAATSDGTPATAIVDYSANGATTGVLRYGFRSGSSASDKWTFRNVPVVAQPQNVALAFDTDDKPWIAVYDQLQLRFMLITNSESDGSGGWSTYYFPFITAATAATIPAYNSVALAMDLSAASITPVMVIGLANHATVGNTGVWSARLNPETGRWSNLTQINSTNLAHSVSNVSADFDEDGRIAVAYYDRSTAHNRVEYSHSVDGGVTWSTATNVNALTAMGQGVKVKLNPSTNRPAIGYYDRANNRVYYSYCTTAIATCNDVNNWTYSFMENFTAGVSGLAATSDGLLNVGLTFASDGDVYAMYPIGGLNTGVLALVSNSTGSFPLSTVVSEGPNANVIDNPAISAINFGQPGWNIDSVRTTTGSMHSVYVGAGNWLYATSCGD